MELKFKKSITSIIIEVLLSLILIFLLIINVYALINYKEETYLYYFVSILGFFLIILLIRIFLFLICGVYPIKLYEGYIIVKKYFKKRVIKYEEIYGCYSSLARQSIATSGYIIIYLNNGKKIKVNYLKQAKDVRDLIHINLKENKDLLLGKENRIKKVFIRILNFFTYLLTRIRNLKESKVLTSLDEFALTYKTNNKKNIFIVISNSIHKNKSFEELFKKFDELNIKYVIHPLSIHNPDIESVLKLKNEYILSSSDSLLAIGGGSIIDLTKALGIAVTNLDKDLSSFKGYFKLHKKIPFFNAIDTVNASGSETTGASVINFENKKCAIYSPKLVPLYTYIGKENIASLPLLTLKRSTLDTLTHSLESYFNLYSYKKYDQKAIESIKIVFNNYFDLTENQNNNSDSSINNIDIERRINLLKASYLGGVSFNHKFVGNVHALSHPLSYKYKLDHSSTNGIILPFILSLYRFNKRFMKKVAILTKELGLIEKVDKEKYEEYLNLLLNKIKEMVKDANLPTYIDEIKGKDLEELATMAYKEAVPLYPTPIIYSKREFMMLYINLKNNKNNDSLK